MMKVCLGSITIFTLLFCIQLPFVNGANPATAGKNIKVNSIPAIYFIPGDSIQPANEEESGPVSLKNNYKIQTVVIDPGHGGHDPGCIGAHSREKHLSLAIGKYLSEGLKQLYPDLKVIMTRSTDVFVPLHERAAIATKHKADLFISIHCNAFPKSSLVRGTETYVLGLHATEENLEVAKRENSAILLEENYQETYGYDPNSPEAHIMFSMFQNAFLEQSILFAEKVQYRAVNHAEMKDRGVKQAGFLVLRYATMPSVLVEAGYLTNHSDENFLGTSEGQKKMAESILHAFTDYKNEAEGNPVTEPVAKINYSEQDPTVTTVKLEDKKSDAEYVASTTGLPDNVAARKKKTNSNPYSLEIAPPSKPLPPKTNTSPVKETPRIIPEEPLKPVVPVKEEVIVKEEKKEKRSPAVNFCVQLAASPKKINIEEGKWLHVGHSVEVVVESGLFKYQVRNFASFEEAEHLKSRLRAKGFSDAFVTAYKDGIKVNPRDLNE